MTHHRHPTVGESRCRSCARVVDELDGVTTPAGAGCLADTFECGPCFVTRERTER